MPGILPGINARHARHICQAYMPGICARHLCQAYMPGVYAKHIHLAHMPGKYVWQQAGEGGRWVEIVCSGGGGGMDFWRRAGGVPGGDDRRFPTQLVPPGCQLWNAEYTGAVCALRDGFWGCPQFPNRKGAMPIVVTLS